MRGRAARRAGFVALCLVLGFLIQGAIGLYAWHDLFDGSNGWLSQVFQTQTHPRSTGWEVVRAYDDAAGGWKDESKYVERWRHPGMGYEVFVVNAHENRDAWTHWNEWMESDFSRTSPPGPIHAVSVWCGFPFGSIGGYASDEFVRGDAAARSYLCWELAGRLRETTDRERGVLLPVSPSLPFAPSVHRTSLVPSGQQAVVAMPPPRMSPMVALANSIFWACLLSIGVGAWSVVRTVRRHRRGLCTKCKYDLAGLHTCPECGTSDHRAAAGLSTSAHPHTPDTPPV